MKKLWMRAGVSLELTDAEVKGILGTDNAGAEDIIKAALLDGRFSFDGDSYIPDVTVDEFVKEHGLPYDPSQEVNFDFSPFGGFTLSKEKTPDSFGQDFDAVQNICSRRFYSEEKTSSDKSRPTGKEGVCFPPLEDILKRYFGLKEGAEIDGSDWVSAYNRLISCIEELGAVTGLSVHELVRELDRIDSEDQ